MARSQKDDPRFGDIQHHAWNYRADGVENCAGGLRERPQPPLPPNSSVMSDNMFGGPGSFAANDVYNNMNKHPYMGAQSGENPGPGNMDEDIALNNMQQNANRPNYVMLSLGNGQMVGGYYDENNKRIMIPVTGQYELFNHNQGMQNIFTLNQDYAGKDNQNVNSVHMSQPSALPTHNYPNDPPNNVPTSNFLKEVLGNWEPNSSGTYSPFGQNYPLNHPDAPTMNLNSNSMPVLEPQLQANIGMGKPETSSPKRSDLFADTGNKKRIVAEVKPMRPTYSDVLAKNKSNTPSEATHKTKISKNIDPKSTGKTSTTKADKSQSNTKNVNEDSKQKSENKKLNMTSSGSESGDINTDDTEKRQKPNKKAKNKRGNMSRKWSSLEDVANEEDPSFNHGDSSSQFVFIENQNEKLSKKDKKEKNKHTDKNATLEEDLQEDEEDDSQYLLNEGQAEGLKARKKKERTYGYKLSKPVPDKKKTTQSKWRKNKPGYLGKAQAYLEHWGGASWKALLWFLYLVSDICRMTAHLSFDLCTSVFTQSYVSSQAVWRSGKEWLRRAAGHRYLLYIDRKLGHTRLGFWRRLKCFKKETDADSGGDGAKLNANIPLPATGEEAMKRLLACKGKDPYSILGVSVGCTDEEIKRYYRRQAFLVHPDKNQQPGAEEAFKILQHAFDIIGEPERREAYDRRAVESRHMEAAWTELSTLLAQLHDKMEFAANTIRCTNCGRRHKRVLTDRPCYAARYCSQCKIRHSAKEGDIWAESSMLGLLVMYYACMDGAVYQITQWASCQKKNLKQLRPDCHVVQYRIVLGNRAQAAGDLGQRPAPGHDPNLEEFLNNLYSKSAPPPAPAPAAAPAPAGGRPPADPADARKRRPRNKTKP